MVIKVVPGCKLLKVPEKNDTGSHLFVPFSPPGFG
jgi:hypothetical protein